MGELLIFSGTTQWLNAVLKYCIWKYYIGMIRSFQKSALSKANNYFDRGAYSCKNDEKSLIYRMETESKNMS